MNRLMLLIISIVSLGWLGHYYVNKTYDKHIKYSNWISIPIVITSTIAMLFLFALTVVLWEILLPSLSLVVISVPIVLITSILSLILVINNYKTITKEKEYLYEL